MFVKVRLVDVTFSKKIFAQFTRGKLLTQEN